MHSIRFLFLFLLPLYATAQESPGQLRYLDIVNRSHNSIVSVSMVDTGGSDFRDLPLGAPLQGGGNAATVPVRAPSCRQDLRVVFRDGRSVIYREIDLCRSRTVRIMPPRGRDADRSLANQ